VTHPGADPLVGRTVAHYEIVARLGGGGMGVVYRAIDRKLGRSVALKFLPQQWSHDEGAKQRFLREAQAASATDHPNICTIHDIATADDGQLFIVMAHYAGETLKRRLEAGPLPIDEALEIATQVADGLARAHAQGIVHRDIKPGNLILTEDGVRIVDFGLATFIDALQLTVQGSTLGTAAYMSPEQVRGEEVDARTDVWAVGIVLYQMLVGHTPFRGAYAEAIGYAIRNDPPPPLRAERPEIPEDVEQLVFRALHKDPAIRFQSGRELARALRQARGLTLPQDLRTQVIDYEPARPIVVPPRRRRPRRAVAAAAAVVLALLAGAVAWLLLPIERETVAVVPVINQTGDADLHQYRLALTLELTSQLIDSRLVRVVPYERVLQIIRRYRRPGQDVSGREAARAIANETGARVLIVPTLFWHEGAWKVQVEYQEAKTGAPRGIDETAPMVSALAKDAVYTLTARVSGQVREHFTNASPLRPYLVERVRGLLTADGPRSIRMRTLDAAAALEQGLDAYEQQEYASALRFFIAASKEDPRHPLPHAWRSRVAMLMRHDDEAAAAADESLRLPAATLARPERLFVEAVASEARREYVAAEARYSELTTRYADEPQWLNELGAFFDRRLRTADAVAAYIQATDIDARLARPRLELCRMYNRLSDMPAAINQASMALSTYTVLGHDVGQALTLLCMADALRVGTDEQRIEARVHAEAASAKLRESKASYNLARAQYYVSMIAGMQGQPQNAILIGEEALTGARREGNAVLEPLVLMNLGVSNARMRRHAPALDYYRQSSRMFEALGDDLRAAQNYLNAGVLIIENGGNLEDGRRDVQNALAVVTKAGDKTFEVSCRHALASYFSHRARPVDAERELNRAIALAGERAVHEIVPSLTIDLAMTHAERGAYAAALRHLDEAIGDGTGPDSPRARIRRAEILTRLGEFARARADLDRAAMDLLAQGNAALRPLLHLRRGELAYESGGTDEARAAFREASALWTDDMPDVSSVEARAWTGLLDELSAPSRGGRAALAESLEQAQRMGRLPLETRVRVLLAEADAAGGRFGDALRTLGAIPDDGPLAISPELRAQALYWRGVALVASGEPSGMARLDEAAGLIERVRTSVPAPYRASFVARRAVQPIAARHVLKSPARR
jgi:tetratricopeptide (TPR) repeat protein